MIKSYRDNNCGAATGLIRAAMLQLRWLIQELFNLKNNLNKIKTQKTCPRLVHNIYIHKSRVCFLRIKYTYIFFIFSALNNSCFKVNNFILQLNKKKVVYFSNHFKWTSCSRKKYIFIFKINNERIKWAWDKISNS